MIRTARLPWRIILGVAGLLSSSAPVEALNVERLEPLEAERLQHILRRLEPLIAARKPDGAVNLLTWDELYQPLLDEDRAFLDEFRALKAETLGSTSHYFGEPSDPPRLSPVGPQQVVKDGLPVPLDPQFLPSDVLERYRTMTAAMARDVGKRLLVESAYRSPAYQLSLFLFYLPKHDYSIRDTNRHVALPGYSEHGNPFRQAIDFINEEGINGEDRPEEFEALPEYQWLLTHAAEFGFHLSYPRDNPHNTAFEPWHWHYEP